MYVILEDILYIILDTEQAKEIQESEGVIFSLNTDNTTHYLEDEKDIEKASENGLGLISEIGSLKDLQIEFEEGEENRFRNNDLSSFEEWIGEKIENF